MRSSTLYLTSTFQGPVRIKRDEVYKAAGTQSSWLALKIKDCPQSWKSIVCTRTVPHLPFGVGWEESDSLADLIGDYRAPPCSLIL